MGSEIKCLSIISSMILHAPQEHVEALGKISASFSVAGVPKTIFAVKQLQSK